MNRSLANLVVDTLAFAREERSVVGEVSLSDLPRLFEMLGDSSLPLQTLACELNGWCDADGHSWLRLRVKGSFDLTCQRCLGPMAFALNIDTELQVIAPGQAWPDEALEDGGVRLGADAIAAEIEQNVLELIEEEVLLALPISPKHAAQELETCVPPARKDNKQAASPFAVLAQLKKH